MVDLQVYVKNSEKILDHLPGYLSITDLKGNFVWLNNKAACFMGVNSIEEIIGKKYIDVKWEHDKSAMIKAENDQLLIARNKNMSFLSYHQYVDGWKMALCEKSLVYNDEKEKIGIINYWSDITDYSLIDINQFLFNRLKDFKYGEKQPFSLYLNKEKFNNYNLSPRQQECLFYLLRGMSDKEIASKLNLSPRTVESYIHEIKNKMQCRTRVEVIEKSLNEGLLNYYLLQNI